jgi:uncharacterized membrane protein
VAVFGLVFVALDMSAPASEVTVFSPFSQVLKNADDEPAELFGADTGYFRNILLPFAIYLLSCCGFIFLILENIRLWRMMNQIRPLNKLMLTIWIILLGLMFLLPVCLGTNLIFEGLWYIFVVIAVILLFYWTYCVSKNL